MRGKSLALLVLALGCGLVASLGITQVMAKRGDGKTPAAETRTVCVAAKDVAMGESLTRETVSTEEWPKDKVPTGTVTSLDDAEGRRAKTKFFAGEPILDQKLFGKGESSGADVLIPKGYRVVSVRVDAVSGGAGLLLPGSRVDLLVHMTRNPSLGMQETITRTILQDIKVFAVNDVVSLDSTGQQDTKSIQARTVSLLATPAQAEKITLASELGTIRLVLRSPDEDSQAQTRGASPHELFGTSDGSRREKETLLPPDLAGLGKDKATGGFVDFLKNMREKMAAEKSGAASAASPWHKEPARWSMRILKGADVADVDLEGSDQLSAADTDLGFWKISGPAAATNLNLQPAAAEPAKTDRDESAAKKDEFKPALPKTKEKKPAGDAGSASASLKALPPRTN